MLKRNTEKSDKILFGVSAAATSILALASAVLSYSALRQLAVDSEIAHSLTYLFPVTIDGLLVSGSTMVLFAADRGKRSPLGIFLTLLGVIASIAGNVAVSPNELTAQLVHGTPPVVLFLSLEALTSLMRQRIKESIVRQEASIAQSEAAKASSVKRVVVKPAVYMPTETGVEGTKSVVRTDVPQQVQEAPSATLAVTSQSQVESTSSSPSIPQQIREVVASQPGVSVEEIAEMINHPDKKYVRRIARQEIEKSAARD